MRQSILNTLKRSSPLLLSMGLGGLVVVGLWVGLSRLWPSLNPSTEVAPLAPTAKSDARNADSRVAALSFQAPAERRSALMALAQQGTTAEQSQARYVLAADQIRQSNGAEALQWLQDLEKSYPLLTPYILSLRAQAHTLTNQPDSAKAIWQQILNQFPASAAAGDAYFALNPSDRRYGDQAIATLPIHPRTVEIAVQRLKTAPNDKALLLLVAQNGLHLKDYTTFLDRLVQKFGPQLTPQDWQNIGFGYWEKLKYKAAGSAYSRALPTARNGYRAARGLQLGNETPKAIAAYQQMIAAFPAAPETPKAMMRLADLTDDSTAAIADLDRALKLAVQLQRPEDAGDALFRKARRLKTVNPTQQATVEAQLLQQYGQTGAAADLRWQRAWSAAQAQQFATAQPLALDIAQFNPDSPQAPRALFWAGKWAERLGKPQERQQAFNQLWQRYPESYYTWRAAALTGQPVGDFQTLRTLTPTLSAPTGRLPLMVGSPALQELYRLGEGQSAWVTWLLEFKQRQQPSIPEQITDGLIRLESGEYIDGLFMLENLRDRLLTEPEQQDQQPTVQALQKDLRYWQALYPTPYWSEIQQWSRQNAVNPALTLALMRQESRFEVGIQSSAGATGLMQLMPDTAAEVAAQLQLKTYRLDNPSDNIRLGTWYLGSTHDIYQNNSMLAIASYNAGPGSVADWLQTLNIQDADVFVETIPFDETQTYVKSVLENYWNYLRLYQSSRPPAGLSRP